MKGKARLLMVLAALYPLGISAQGIADIVRSLEDTQCFQAKATYSVTLPQNDTDVVYDLTLKSMATEDDPLLPCSYLIDWSLATPSGPTEGFSAYYPGNHYRFQNDRLQEYHMEWDSIPFSPGPGMKGVQASAQFVDLLPQMMGAEINAMSHDDRYTLSVVPGRRFDGKEAIELRVMLTISDEVVMERTYVFEASTLRPLRIATESNPGSITEQSILVTYTMEKKECEQISEEALMALYPEVFEKYRESNFRIENMRGLQLPTFSLPTVSGARYTHHKGENLQAPVIIALMDPAASFCGELVKSVRSAAAKAAVAPEVIWAFATTNHDMVESVMPEMIAGEHTLLNARSLARDCGAASLPVIILADKRGVVKNVVLGFNNEIENIVVQTIALMD